MIPLAVTPRVWLHNANRQPSGTEKLMKRCTRGLTCFCPPFKTDARQGQPSYPSDDSKTMGSSFLSEFLNKMTLKTHRASGDTADVMGLYQISGFC